MKTIQEFKTFPSWNRSAIAEKQLEFAFVSDAEQQENKTGKQSLRYYEFSHADAPMVVTLVAGIFLSCHL